MTSVGDETRTVAAGQSVFLPHGVSHRFETVEPARWPVVGSGSGQIANGRLSAAVRDGAEGLRIYARIDGVEYVAD